jgi:ribosomal protein S27AE
MKKDTQFDKNDVCVKCGSRTNYSQTDPIDTRYGYIEGTGQLCFKCSYFDEHHKNKLVCQI